MTTEVQCNGHLDASPLISNSLNHNESHRTWVVQKFGGTSVGKFAVNIAEDIVRWVDCETFPVKMVPVLIDLLVQV